MKATEEMVKTGGENDAFSAFRFREAVIDDAKRMISRVVIITEGLGNLRDKNYYTASAVKSAAEIFKGKQFYLNHPSSDEEETRPERSVRDLAGYFGETAVGTVKDPDTGETLTACFATLKCATSQAGKDAFEQIKTAIQYQKEFPESKDVYCGISINGGGISHPGEIDGMEVNMVTEIQEAFSADIVTKPARGGKFLALMQEAAKAARMIRLHAQETAQQGKRGDHMRKPVVETKNEKHPKKLAPVKAAVKEAVVAKPQDKKALVEQAKKIGARKLHLIGSGLVGAAKEARAGKLTVAGLGVMVEAATATGKKMGSLADKLGKLKSEAEGPTADLSDMIIDLQQDIADLAAALDMGGPAKPDDAAVAGDEPMVDDPGAEPEAEDEPIADDELDAEEDPEEEPEEAEETGDAGTGDGAMGGIGGSRMSPGGAVASEDEESAEAEEEAVEKEEGETAEAEEESVEKESGDEMEKEAVEGEDEAEEKEAVEGEEAQEAFPPKDDEEKSAPKKESKPLRMAYQCAKCGETNQVAPPKGHTIMKTDEAKSSESQALAATVSRLRKTLEAKEARMGKTVETLTKENITLKAENQAFKRAIEAKKALREAKVPPSILKVADLLAYEPHQWASQIKFAQRSMAEAAKRESDILNGVKPGQGGSGSGKVAIKDEAISTFNESYKKASR